ncbi:NAD(P)/FAD-dependent oxidoreductase [Amycolatopsis cihanbeyliensis]|uniref:Glycine/D-amino acid oxidase-like deaminating enzyme n=1 Tax=Amycolatopsis cihanbeyliensis TaxID=1128664 RepID=A0A542DQH3_AMYCI|nr:FAD-dependent oxidoreductase [Amycolatopsis cihanbeyliensis]TQJ05353.1 glycine/D-amino acid oxidase-like deaminating enzyme [Amycolatopsis cihanbeyliensis]
MSRTRVLVVGAGIIGAACARELAESGLEVIVLDRDRPGGATTAHGEGNVLVSDKGPGPELELAKLSRTLWPQTLASIGARAGAEVEWDPKGGIVVATTEEGARELAAFVERQRAAGVVVERLDATELAAAEPHLTPAVTAAFHYPEDAQVQPVAAATTLLSAALDAGATLRTGCRVLGAHTEGGRLTGIRTSQGVLGADAFVNAAGPWAGELSALLGAPVDVRPRRGEVLVTTPMPPTVFHKVYDAGYVGAVGSDSAELRTSAVVESTKAGTILLGSSRRQVGFDASLRVDVLSAIAGNALRLFPGLGAATVMRAYGGFRPYVPDHLPIIGADPRRPGLWHASGHEGAGIGLAAGTARLLRNLLLDEPAAIEPEPFRVGRAGVMVEGDA